MFARLLKDVIKDEAIHRVKSRKVLSTEAPIPLWSQVYHNPGT